MEKKKLSVSSCSDGDAKIVMDDEYKEPNQGYSGVTDGIALLETPLELENGESIENLNIKYATYGKLNADRTNAILICHALTGNCHVHQYWDAFVSDEWTEKYFIICTNNIGSCYGSTGPSFVNSNTNRIFGSDFPSVTIRDAVNAQKRVLSEVFGLQHLQAVIGGSLGGMMTLEWALIAQEHPKMDVKAIVPISCPSQQSAWQLAFNELQRQAIRMDVNYRDGKYDPENPPILGLSLARQIAMVSYRAHAAYVAKYGRDREQSTCTSDVAPYTVQSYLHYQGRKFISRFDPNSYMTTMDMMDSHDIGRGRNGVSIALEKITQPALVIGVSSDVLFPLSEQVELAEKMPKSELKVLESVQGHDAFLLNQQLISKWTFEFLRALE